MKTTNKFIAVSAMVMATGILLAGCQRENIAPQASALDPAADEIVIPVSVEGAISVDGTGTKVTIDPTTGETAWQTNELIGVYVSGTGANKYVQAAVSGNAVRLSLSSGQTRANYAVYPYSAAGGSTTPTVVYPNSYDMTGKDLTSANTWAPTPMVAVNTPGEDLRFFHVGGLLRLHVTEIPSGTTSLTVTFTGLSNVFGTFTVSNPGTTTASTTYSSDGSNAVTFTNLTIVGGEAYLNIPVPTKDFSALTAITVTNTGGTSYTATKSVYGWGAFTHGTGKKTDASFVSITHGASYTGKFRGLEISKGYLVWDKTAGEYKLSDPDDPFLPIRFYGITNSGFQDTYIKNIILHQWSSLKGRLDGAYSSVTPINNGAAIEGLIWRLPTQDQWKSIVCSTGTPNDVRINDTSTTSTPYSYIRVNLAGATSVGEEGYDYHGKGLNNATGDQVTANTGGYQVGLLLVPDYTTVTCPGFTAGNKSFTAGTAISWSALKMLLDGGCVFLPAEGFLSGSGSWANGGTQGRYWASTIENESYAHDLFFYSNFLKHDNDALDMYLPVVLIR